MNARKRVIIVGGGFGGLNAAKGLLKLGDLDILLLDRRNHHLFQPLLYQVAMAGLSPAEISIPIRSLFRSRQNVEVLLADVQDVRVGENKVVCDIGEFSYDYLILACGSEHSYFGHTEWEEHAPGLKTLEQATEIRRRVLTAFERAEAEPSAELRKQWLTFAVVGGGPTGVELAGALGEITRFTLSEDFRHIDPSVTRVLLIEAGPRLLAQFHEDLGRKASRDLESLGVQIWTGCRVTEVNAAGVRIGNEFIEARTVIWAAGVKPSHLNPQLQTPLDKQGRVLVKADLSLPSFPNVFVIGDQAALADGAGGFLPGLAPVAMQQGRCVARQVAHDFRGQPRESFKYNDKGQMATIGRRRAVAQVGSLRFSGYLAWWMWLLIHVYYLIGFKNRFFVMWEWAFSYFTYRRGARLITRKDWRSSSGPDEAADASK